MGIFLYLTLPLPAPPYASHLSSLAARLLAPAFPCTRARPPPQVFLITAGETRIYSLPYAAEGGGLHWGPTAFVISYILVVNWVLLQVPPHAHPSATPCSNRWG